MEIFRVEDSDLQRLRVTVVVAFGLSSCKVGCTLGLKPKDSVLTLLKILICKVLIK